MEALKLEWGKMHLEARKCAGPALVFANSLGTDMRMWNAVLPHLPEDWTCLRMDKRGHGLSDAAPDPYDLTHLAEDLIAAMDYAGLERAVIVGCSVGGLIAQHVALVAPERVTALVLSNTASKLVTASVWRERIAGIRARGMAAMADEILPRWFGPAMMARPEADLWRNLLRRTDPQGYMATCDAISRADVTARLAEITQPALVIGGQHDMSTPPEVVERLAAGLPRADLALFEQSGHLPAIEEPAEFAAMIRGFVERNAT